MVDEAQDLDKLLEPTENGGGARCALRILRELQLGLFDATGGNVVVLPLAIGIRPEVSIVEGTLGKLVAVGMTGDEALLSRKDFYALAATIFDRIPSVAGLSPKEKTFLAALHYPHVRSLLDHRPEVCKFQPATIGFDEAKDANQLVVHALCGTPMPLKDIPTWIPVKRQRRDPVPQFRLVGVYG